MRRSLAISRHVAMCAYAPMVVAASSDVYAGVLSHVDKSIYNDLLWRADGQCGFRAEMGRLSDGARVSRSAMKRSITNLAIRGFLTKTHQTFHMHDIRVIRDARVEGYCSACRDKTLVVASVPTTTVVMGDVEIVSVGTPISAVFDSTNPLDIPRLLRPDDPLLTDFSDGRLSRDALMLFIILRDKAAGALRVYAPYSYLTVATRMCHTRVQGALRNLKDLGIIAKGSTPEIKILVRCADAASQPRNVSSSLGTLPETKTHE